MPNLYDYWFGSSAERQSQEQKVEQTPEYIEKRAEERRRQLKAQGFYQVSSGQYYRNEEGLYL